MTKKIIKCILDIDMVWRYSTLLSLNALRILVSSVKPYKTT